MSEHRKQTQLDWPVNAIYLAAYRTQRTFCVCGKNTALKMVYDQPLCERNMLMRQERP